jgi:hypothetical protein
LWQKDDQLIADSPVAVDARVDLRADAQAIDAALADEIVARSPEQTCLIATGGFIGLRDESFGPRSEE